MITIEARSVVEMTFELVRCETPEQASDYMQSNHWADDLIYTDEDNSFLGVFKRSGLDDFFHPSV